jgi:hypothetical protein
MLMERSGTMKLGMLAMNACAACMADLTALLHGLCGDILRAVRFKTPLMTRH